MLDDEIITKLAEEAVKRFDYVDDTFKTELLEAAKTTIRDEYRKRILKGVAEYAVLELNSYLSAELEDDVDDAISSVVKFLDLSSTVIEDRPVSEVYFEYFEFCKDRGWKPVSKIKFSKMAQRCRDVISTVTTVNMRSVRVFKGK